jgi:hypothetical protein
VSQPEHSSAAPAAPQRQPKTLARKSSKKPTPSGIAAPHLDQYTVPPRFFLALGKDSQESQPNPTFKHRQGQSSPSQPAGGKNCIALVPDPSPSPLPVLPRIYLISHALAQELKLPQTLVHFVPFGVTPVQIEWEETQ